MKVLHLTLKSKWYDMIEAGIKAEEYREIKPFWTKRLTDSRNLTVEKLQKIVSGTNKTYFDIWKSEFDEIRFARGGHFHPSLPQMTIEFKGIEINTGNPNWGAEPNKKYFVIKLGKILTQSK